MTELPKILALFPGQGSQFPGMGKTVLAEFPYTAQVFEKIEDLMHVRVRALCFEADRATLTQTQNAQPCLFAVSTAYHHVLKQEIDFSPHIYAGHSLGEFSALAASEKLSLTTACQLVKKRAQTMQSAIGKGEMLAVISTDIDQLSTIVAKLNAETDEIVDIANYNSPRQTVVAGSFRGIELLQERLTTANIKHIKVPVSAPFHSRLMKDAETTMQNDIMHAEFVDNDARIIPNYLGTLTPYKLEYLVKQISNPVQWTTTTHTALAAGCNVCVEIGAKKVLTSLLRNFPTWKGQSFVLDDDLHKFLKFS